MVILLYGEDGYRINKHLEELRGDFCRSYDQQGLNVLTFDAGRSGAEELMEAALTVPFLAGRKFIVARGFLTGSKAAQESVTGMVERVPETTTVVFVENASARDLSKSPLVGSLSTKPGSREFVAITPRSIGSVFSSELRKLGVAVDREAEIHAASVLPSDSWQIVQEAEKAASYASAHGKQTLGVADLADILSGGTEDSVFAFLDACLEGNPSSAACQIVSLMDGGMSEYQVVAAVTKQVRTLVAVRDSLDRGVGDKQVIAKNLKMHPYPVEKAIWAVRGISSQILRRLFGLCLDTETGLKTGGAGRESVELLAVRLAVIAKGGRGVSG